MRTLVVILLIASAAVAVGCGSHTFYATGHVGTWEATAPTPDITRLTVVVGGVPDNYTAEMVIEWKGRPDETVRFTRGQLDEPTYNVTFDPVGTRHLRLGPSTGIAMTAYILDGTVAVDMY